MPKENLIRLVAFVAAIIGVVAFLFTDNRGVRIAHSNNDGTVVLLSRTNAPVNIFGNEPTCQGGGCHELPDQSPMPGEALGIEVRDSSSAHQIVNSYQPGQTYQIRVTHTVTGTGWGFQLTAIDGAFNRAGVLSSPDGTTITRCAFSTGVPAPCNDPGNPRFYTNHFSRRNSNWSFNWVAPSANMGTVTFYAAGVRIIGGANANPADDLVYTTSKALPVSPPGTLQFSAATFNQSEGGGTATITVTRTGGSSGAASVQFSTTMGGTATGGASCSAGVDYRNTSGTLNWVDGDASSKTFLITICSDNVFEGNETLNLMLSNASGATLGAPSTATLIISDDDSQPTISINDVTQAEGNSGTTNFGFTVSLSNPTTQTVSVNYATADDTATAASGDYQAISSTLLTFNPGETTKTITVLVNGDTVQEQIETFFVNLSGASGATIADAQGLGTIIDDDASISTLQFSASSYTVDEGAGSATLTVLRSGSTSSPATVDFGISTGIAFVPCNITSGNASQNCDYIFAAGTLSFASGDTSKSFKLLIVDDAYVEGNETLNLSLSSATGGVLGPPSSAVVTITDNDTTPPAVNPLDDAQFFVRQQYYDFLSREPDPGGLGYWTNEITKCASNVSCLNERRVAVSDAFLVEREYQDTGLFVYLVYKEAFGNRPSYDQFRPDRSRVLGGSGLSMTKDDFVSLFVQRSAFTSQYPANLTPEQYVDALNGNTGNSLTQAQRDALVNGLKNSTESRASVLRKVAENSVFIDREYNSSFVLSVYFDLLRRDPELGGFDFWLMQINRFPPRSGSGQQALVCSFITSREYQERFSSIISHTNADCQQ